MANTDELKLFTYADYANMYDKLESLSSDYREATDYLQRDSGSISLGVSAEFRKEFEQERFDHETALSETMARADEELGIRRDSLRDGLLSINNESSDVRQVVETFADDPFMAQQRVTMDDLKRLQELGDGRTDPNSVMAEISQEHKELDASRDYSRYSQQDYQIADEMADMFRDNGFEPIYVTSPGNPRLDLSIEPCAYGEKRDLSDIDYYLANSSAANLYGGEQLVEVAHTFNTLPEIERDAKDSETKLHEFFEEHVAGRTEEQWDLAGRVSWLMHDSWKGSNTSYSDHFEAVLPEISERLQIPEGVARDAMSLSEAAGTFSDWSKDVYGHRLRDYGEAITEREGKLFGGLYESQYDAAYAKEHPGAELRDRADVYEAVDAEMHRQEIRDVPNHLVRFEEQAGASMAVVRIPDAGWGYDDKLDPAHKEDSMTLPADSVKQNQDGTYQLILDDRKSYDVDSSYSFDSNSIRPGELHNRMASYHVFCERMGIEMTGPVNPEGELPKGGSLNNVPSNMIDGSSQLPGQIIVMMPNVTRQEDAGLQLGDAAGGIRVPVEQVKANENGTFDVSLSPTQKYPLYENPQDAKSSVVDRVDTLDLYMAMSQYRTYANQQNLSITYGTQQQGQERLAELSGKPIEKAAVEKAPVETQDAKEPTVLKNMGKNSVQFFQTKDGKDMAAVSVPHEPSPYGSGKIYVPADDVKVGKRGGYDVTLQADSYTVNYNVKGDDGKQVRMHDRGVATTDIKDHVDARQRENREARLERMSGVSKSERTTETQFQ